VPASETENPLLTQREAADLLRVHPRTLRRRVYTDGFPQPIKSGDRVLYVRAEVHGYLRRKMAAREQQTA
jgi:predicted DNA-binding transcriptional regulator AlpA